MDDATLGQALGALNAELKAVDERLTDHILEERERDDRLLIIVSEIKSTLSEATNFT